jgi:hypothetical protein
VEVIPQQDVLRAEESALPHHKLSDEETLVEDPRSRQSPSQQIEEKLIRTLKASPVLVSQVQLQRKPGPR